MPEVEAELARRLVEGEQLVLATVIRLGGVPPSHPGAKALLGREAVLAGTLGCSEFDAAALAGAGELLAAGAPAIRTYSHELGSIEVYLEPYQARPALVVLGHTPVADALARWAPELGFSVHREPPAPDAAGELYVVHTNHDDPDLVAQLTGLLAREPRFVGLVGSRRHTGHHLEALRARGLGEAQIGGIQSPVGLDLGARTPEEIALAILGGLVAVRRGAPGGWLAAR